MAKNFGSSNTSSSPVIVQAKNVDIPEPILLVSYESITNETANFCPQNCKVLPRLWQTQKQTET